jgi:predicted flap endonuclease-1-like 5' DNA nuclease
MILKTDLAAEMLQQSGGSTWTWLWVFLAVVLILAFAAIWNARKSGEDIEVHQTHAESETPSEPDNLAKIEGIGPKISSVFQSAGISTFAQMAESEVTVLQQILDDAGIRLGDPTTWPQQAKLASSGDWDALEKLQDELLGGRQS